MLTNHAGTVEEPCLSAKHIISQYPAHLHISQPRFVFLKPDGLPARFLNVVLLLLHIPGIEPHGNTVLQPAVFTVDTQEAGSGEVLVYVEDPEGYKEEVITWHRFRHHGH